MNKTNDRPHVWSRLAAFDHPKPAETLVAFLDQHGFVVRLYDERKLQRYWFLTRPMAGMCVQVPEDTLPAARDFLLAQPEGYDLLRTAIHCPACKSTRVHYPQMTRKNVLPTLVAHVLVALGLLRHEYYCEDCHFTWTRGEQRPKSRVKRSPNIPLFGTRKQATRAHRATSYLIKP
jgi:hypothetical protein